MFNQITCHIKLTDFALKGTPSKPFKHCYTEGKSLSLHVPHFFYWSSKCKRATWIFKKLSYCMLKKWHHFFKKPRVKELKYSEPFRNLRKPKILSAFEALYYKKNLKTWKQSKTPKERNVIWLSLAKENKYESKSEFPFGLKAQVKSPKLHCSIAHPIGLLDAKCKTSCLPPHLALLQLKHFLTTLSRERKI